MLGASSACAVETPSLEKTGDMDLSTKFRFENQVLRLTVEVSQGGRAGSEARPGVGRGIPRAF